MKDVTAAIITLIDKVLLSRRAPAISRKYMLTPGRYEQVISKALGEALSKSLGETFSKALGETFSKALGETLRKSLREALTLYRAAIDLTPQFAKKFNLRFPCPI